ncbi:MAG: hypothetical protein V3V35_08830 [Dehalococcoidia bacterium]
MKQFRLKVDSRLAPERLIDGIAHALDDLTESRAKEGWRVDQRAERFIAVSRQLRPSRWRGVLRFFEFPALARLGVSPGSWGFSRPAGQAEAPMGPIMLSKPENLQPRHEILSAQAYQARRGSELELKGAGRSAQRLARELLRYVEGASATVLPGSSANA